MERECGDSEENEEVSRARKGERDILMKQSDSCEIAALGRKWYFQAS